MLHLGAVCTLRIWCCSLQIGCGTWWYWYFICKQPAVPLPVWCCLIPLTSAQAGPCLSSCCLNWSWCWGRKAWEPEGARGNDEAEPAFQNHCLESGKEQSICAHLFKPCLQAALATKHVLSAIRYLHGILSPHSGRVYPKRSEELEGSMFPADWFSQYTKSSGHLYNIYLIV